MREIIISYRRKDSDAITGRIRDRIGQHFGDNAIFMDIDNIPLGFDFRKYIQDALGETRLMLAIIGPNWTGLGEAGMARILEDSDPVRIEVETALQRGIPTIPVLVGGAQMPKSSDLPPGLKDFPFLNAAEVSAGVDFNQHIDRLIRACEQILKGKIAAEPHRPARAKQRGRIFTSAAVSIVVLAAVGLGIAYRAGMLIGPRQVAETVPPPPIERPPQNEPVLPVLPTLPTLPIETQQPAPAPMPPVATPVENPAPPPATPVQTTPVQSAAAPARPPTPAESRVAAASCEAGTVPVFYDNFKVVDSAWDGLGTDPRAGFYLADGELVMATSPNDNVYFNRAATLRNASICLRIISPPSMADPYGGRAGLMFWQSSDQDYYEALLFPGGGFKIDKWVKGSVSVVAQGKTNAILVGPRAANVIKLSNRGDTNTLFINGSKVQEFKGQPGKNDNQIGIIASSESKQLDEWRFTGIVMSVPNYGDEYSDFGVPPQNVLQQDVGTVTPLSIPGARVISTGDLSAATQRGSLDGAAFQLIDVLYDSHPKTIRGAKRLPTGGAAGSFDDETQQRLWSDLSKLVKNNLTQPIVFFCEGARCWESYNAALRAEKMGFTRVYWYRGGLTAWKQADLPMN